MNNQSPFKWRRFEADIILLCVRKKAWMYLYRAVDSEGNTLEFLLSATRDAEAATRFARQSTALHGLFGSSSSCSPGADGPA